MKSKIKIYFLENSFDYNGNDLNSDIIGGSEKTLINISSELAKNEAISHLRLIGNDLEDFIASVSSSTKSDYL